MQDGRRTDGDGDTRDSRRFGRLHGNRTILLITLLALLMAIGVWLFATLDSLPSMADVIGVATQWRDSPFAIPLALCAFVVGGLVVFPVNVLIATSILVFGPIGGALVALCGSVLSAMVVYELGRWLPPSLITRALGHRGEALRSRLVDHGLLAVAVIRIVPVAPYSLVSLFAGITRIRRLDYVLGTALGMTPGILVYAIFIERAREALMNPHPLAWLGLLGALGLVIALALGSRAWSRRNEDLARGKSE